MNLDEGWARVRQIVQRIDGELRMVEPKTARSRRTIPLPATTLEALKAHRLRQDVVRKGLGKVWRKHDLVVCSAIGSPIDPDNVNREFNQLCERAGVQRVRVHDLPPHVCDAPLRQGRHCGSSWKSEYSQIASQPTPVRTCCRGAA